MRTTVVGMLLVAFLSVPVRAQSACATPNCLAGVSPAPCQNRAAPRLVTVFMTESFLFDPDQPRIEQGGCVRWEALSFSHSASSNTCPDNLGCLSPAPPTCLFDSGNVTEGAGNFFSMCHYHPGTFLPDAGNAFYCRQHASPTVGTMRGTLRVTTPIVLSVNKNPGTGSVELLWTGGGVAGDASYKVARQTGGDPLFPEVSTTTEDPNGGVLGTAYTDAGDLLVPTTRYYLVRNKQINE